MSHAFQTVLWMLLQHLAPRHNAQIRFLKAQIQILRRRIPSDRIVPNPDEKAELLRLSKEFGHDVKLVMDIVKPTTYRKWINDAKKGIKPKRSGRPRISQELRTLVVRMGTENLLWGYRRIVGELKKLGHYIGVSSVKRILLEHGIHPTPEKREKRQPPMPWSQFIQSHMDSLVATDFFTKPVYTLCGRFDAYCLVFIHLASRRVFCSPPTFHPNEAWVIQQARNAAMWMDENGIHPRMLLMDNDTKFSLAFRRFWKSVGVRPKRLPFFAPNANAFTEAFIANLKAECLNHFIIFSMGQLDYVIRTWVDYYNTERPHRGKGIGNQVLDGKFRANSKGIVYCRERLGGLIKSYYRDVA